jgi:hypothetical protein
VSTAQTFKAPDINGVNNIGTLSKIGFSFSEYLQVALHFIIGKAIHFHELSNLLRCGNLGATKLLKCTDKALMKLRGPTPPCLALGLTATFTAGTPST